MSENIQVPQGWEVKKLREVVEINNTRVLSEQLEPLSISAGIGFVNQTEKFGRDLAGKQYEKYIKIKKYDFAYNKGNSKKYPQGCIYLLKDREHAAIPNVFECFRIKNYNCFYYEQLFISGFLNKQLYRLINAGVRNDGLLNLNSENFYSCYIPVPPLEEQKKIADILSLWDKAIEQTKDLIAYKEKQKKGLMQALLTGKKRLNGFTDEWKTYQLGECFKFLRGEGLSKEMLDNNGKNYCILYGELYTTYSEVISDIVSKTNYTTSMLSKNGDVLIPCSTTTKAIDLATASSIKLDNILIGGDINILRPTIDINSDFIAYYITNIIKKKIATYAQGTTIIHLYGKDIKPIKIKIPTINEQNLIINIIKNADEEINLLNKQLELYTEQKKGLMQNLLTGKVRV